MNTIKIVCTLNAGAVQYQNDGDANPTPYPATAMTVTQRVQIYFRDSQVSLSRRAHTQPRRPPARLQAWMATPQLPAAAQHPTAGCSRQLLRLRAAAAPAPPPPGAPTQPHCPLPSRAPLQATAEFAFNKMCNTTVCEWAPHLLLQPCPALLSTSAFT
jgi:hypothetical protein